MHPLLLVFHTIACVAGTALPGGKDSDKPRYELKKDICYLANERSATSYQRQRCRLDIYHPSNRTGFATVVWFHGGGLTGGSRHIPTGLQGKGIAVVAANYRLHPKVTCPAYPEDAAAAVAWTSRNIKKYGGDADRIFVSGHSAGGYLASMVGIDKRWLAKHGIDADRLAGLIPLSGHAITHMTVRKERGIPGNQPVVDAFAPFYHVRPDAPPILLVLADADAHGSTDVVMKNGSADHLLLAQQGRQDVETVLAHCIGQAIPRNRGERGHHVGEADQHVADRSRFYHLRPAGDGGHAMAPWEVKVLYIQPRP